MAFVKFDPGPFLTSPERTFSSISNFSDGQPFKREPVDATVNELDQPETTQGHGLSGDARTEPSRPAKPAKAAKPGSGAGCSACGRPQHLADICCPVPTPPDPDYPVEPGFVGSEPERWDVAVADAWLAITLERIGKLHDELAPDCDIDTPDWDRAEAVVNAAYLMRNRQALRDALAAYEAHARTAFTAWAQREAA